MPRNLVRLRGAASSALSVKCDLWVVGSVSGLERDFKEIIFAVLLSEETA